MGRNVPAVVKRNSLGDFIKLSAGDTCMIAGEENQEWYMSITNIMKVGPVNGCYHLMVNGTYFIPGFLNGHVVNHPWKKTVQLLPRQYQQHSVQLVNKITRKIILYPEPTNRDEPTYHIPVDFDLPSVARNVQVPVRPHEDDVLGIRGVGGATWYGKVREVERVARRVPVIWLRETRRRGVWSLTRQSDRVHFNSILSTEQAVLLPGGLFRLVPQ